MFRNSAIASLLVLAMTSASFAHSVIAYGTVTDQRGFPLEGAQVFIGYYSPMTPCPIRVSDLVEADHNGVYSVDAAYRELERGTTYHLFARTLPTQGYSSEASKLWNPDYLPLNPMYFQIPMVNPGTPRRCLEPFPYPFDIHD